LTDPRTGLVHREWYNFFFSLFELTGGGQNQMSITDLMVGPPTTDVDLSALIADVLTEPTDSPLVSQLAVVAKAIQSLGVVPPVPDTMALAVALQGLQKGPADAGLTERVAELRKVVQALQVAPVAVPPPASLPYVRTATTTPVTITSAEAAVGATIYVKLAAPGAVAVSLPAGFVGAMATVKDGTGDAGVNNITTTPAAGNIDGAGTDVIATNWASRTYIYTDTEWSII